MPSTTEAHTVTGPLVAEAVTKAFGRNVVDERVIYGESFYSICLRDDSGQRYVAKLAQQPYSREEVQWQEQLLDRLERAQLKYQTPVIVRDSMQRTVSRVDLGIGGKTRELMLLTWVDGDLLAGVTQPSFELLADVGKLSATLTAEIGHLDVPFAHRNHHWVLTQSLDALAGLDQSMGTWAERSQIGRVADFFRRYSRDLSDLPNAAVHQDLNTHNITVDRNRQNEVHGVIDFNDAVRTVRVADLAIASAYSMFNQEDPVAACIATVNGYQQITALTPEERSVVLPLAMIRLAVNWATWSQLSGGDESSYAASRMKATFPVIEKLVEEGLEDARTELLKETS